MGPTARTWAGQHILKISGRSTGFSVGAEYRLTIGEPSRDPLGQGQAMPAPATGTAPVTGEARMSE